MCVCGIGMWVGRLVGMCVCGVVGMCVCGVGRHVCMWGW